MMAISSSYSEAEDRLTREVPLYESLTGATANSGIERETLAVQSLSMTDSPQTALAVEVITKGQERILLWRPKGGEWTGLYTSLRLPENIREDLAMLREEECEDTVYKIADSIAKWMADASGAEQRVLATSFGGLTVRGVRILLSAIADAEVQLRSEHLLHTIAGFLGSEDKRLAQTAGVCLLQCGGGLGGTLLRARLNDPASLPHIQLILGAIHLLSSQ